MKTMKILGMSFTTAMSLALAGCGGGGNAAAPGPVAGVVNPYGAGQYGSTPYTCQPGMIQLRNAFGQAQCFQTPNIADACAQLGGNLYQGIYCRKERQIQGMARGSFWNNGNMAPDNIPLRLNLFQGEGVKVYGKISSMYGEISNWDAQLIQNGAVLGSASGDTIGGNAGAVNLSITSVSTTNSAQYSQPYSPYQQTGGYPSQAGYPGGYPSGAYSQGAYSQGAYSGAYPNPYQPSIYPNQYGSVYNAGFYNQPAIATPSLVILQIMFQGKIRVELHASAIGCEDGHGNSYPCQ